jgi:hypothetical protein
MPTDPMFWSFVGLGCLFGLPFLLGGIGMGIASHGFKLIEINHHYHGEKKDGDK